MYRKVLVWGWGEVEKCEREVEGVDFSGFEKKEMFSFCERFDIFGKTPKSANGFSLKI